MKVGALAGLYTVAAQAGFLLADVHPVVTPVWPPTGIALVALLRLGDRVWPGVALGAFLANLMGGVPLIPALGIGAGNTLEAVVGAYLVRRFVGVDDILARPRSILAFALLAAGSSTIVSATVGTASLVLGGVAAAADLLPIWLTWWVGDAASDLVIAPLLLAWTRRPYPSWSIEDRTRAALIVLSAGVVAWLVFAPGSPVALGRSPVAFTTLPFVAWAAFSFAQRGSTAIVFMFWTSAAWALAWGSGPFAVDPPALSVLLMQGFIAVASLAGMILAAVVADRSRAEEDVARSRARYQTLVSSVRGIVWEADAETYQFTFVSPAAERITGWPPSEWLSDPTFWRDHVHPDDRGWAVDFCTSATREMRPHEFEYRLLTADGGHVWLHDVVTVETSGGKPSKLRGVMVDITPRKKAEEALRELEARLATIVSASPIILFSLDPDGTYTLSEGKGLGTLGLRPAELVGRSIFDVYAQNEGILQNARKALSGQHVSALEELMGVWIETHWIPVHDDRGSVARVMGVSIDVTERHRAELAVRKSEEEMSTILGSVACSVWSAEIDEQDRWEYRYFSPVVARIAGRPPDFYAAGPDRWLSTVHPEDIPRLVDAFERIRSGGTREEENEYRILRPDGSTRWVQESVEVQRRNGRARVYGFIVDVTERRQAQAALNEYASEIEDLYEHAPCGYHSIDKDGNFVRMNQTELRWLGYEHDEIVGKHITQFLTAPSRETFDEVFPRFLEGEDVHDLEMEFLRRDGSILAVLESATSVRDAEGDLLMSRSIVVDVTERKKWESELRESEMRKGAILESALDAIVSMDHEGKVIDFNSAAERSFGRSRQEASGKPMADLIIPERLRERHRKGLAHFLATGEGPILGKRIEMPALRSDGTEFPVELTVVAIATQGLPVFTATIRDITQRREAEEAVRKLNEELDERVRERTRELQLVNQRLAASNRELEAFSYSVSHDLRAPLRAMAHRMEAIEEDHGEALPSEVREHIDRAKSATQRMRQLINDLLKLTGVTRAEINLERIDLTAMAREIVAELRQGDPERRVVVDIGEGLEAEGDRELLRALLDNLLGNAWKFTGKRQDARIRFDATWENDQRVLFVEDNGAGFDMSKAQRLFTPFQRLHARSEFPGTGIGLSLVQRVVDRHGGRVWAKSEEGKGATFFFTLAP